MFHTDIVQIYRKDNYMVGKLERVIRLKCDFNLIIQFDIALIVLIYNG